MDALRVILKANKSHKGGKVKPSAANDVQPERQGVSTYFQDQQFPFPGMYNFQPQLPLHPSLQDSMNRWFWQNQM